MNFFSHYYLDRQHAQPYYILGALLPELFPGFNQHLRKNMLQHQPETEEEQHLLHGIHQHYTIDAIFHNSDFFKEQTSLIKNTILQNAQLVGLHYRTFFLAHITLELLIDRILIQIDLKEPKDFYQFLQEVNLKPIEQLFQKTNLQYHYPLFQNIYSRHISVQYLFYYNNNEKFIEALLRLYLKINTHMQSVETKKAFISTILGLELVLQEEIQIFVTNFKKTLNGQPA